LNVHADRIEAVSPTTCPGDVLTSRALASLDQLFSFAEPWAIMNPQMRCLFHKGREYQAEIEASRGEWDFDLIDYASSTSEEARILEITHLQRKTSAR
ncbi:MAG: RsmG family class I SAM-dependent methyltransferase, partial [Pseudomonadota bacterium]